MPNIEASGKLLNVEDATMVYHYNQLQIVYDNGEFIYKRDNETTHWKSLQFHFHAPAEHHLDGFEYEAELHIVFKNVEDPTRLLVTGILLTADSDAERSEFIDSLKLEGITDGHYKRNIIFDGLYEKFFEASTYNYKGSLTTPPCTESVEWIVIGEPLRLSDDQIRLFLSLWPENKHFANGNGSDREIQKLNERQVYSIKFNDDMFNAGIKN